MQVPRQLGRPIFLPQSIQAIKKEAISLTSSSTSKLDHLRLIKLTTQDLILITNHVKSLHIKDKLSFSFFLQYQTARLLRTIFHTDKTISHINVFVEDLRVFWQAIGPIMSVFSPQSGLVQPAVSIKGHLHQRKFHILEDILHQNFLLCQVASNHHFKVNFTMERSKGRSKPISDGKMSALCQKIDQLSVFDRLYVWYIIKEQLQLLWKSKNLIEINEEELTQKQRLGFLSLTLSKERDTYLFSSQRHHPHIFSQIQKKRLIFPYQIYNFSSLQAIESRRHRVFSMMTPSMLKKEYFTSYVIPPLPQEGTLTIDHKFGLIKCLPCIDKDQFEDEGLYFILNSETSKETTTILMKSLELKFSLEGS